MRYQHIMVALAFVVSGASISTTAHAQWDNNFQVPVWNPGLDLLADSLRPPSNDDAGTKDYEEPKQQSPLEKLHFSRSSSRARQNLMSFATDLRAKDQTKLDPLEYIFVRSDLENDFVDVDLDLQAYRAMNPMGLRNDNLIDAYTLWWVTMWEAAYGRPTFSSRPGMYGMVKRQVTEKLLQIPQFQSASNEQKQDFADALVVKALLLRDYMNKLEDSPTDLRTFGGAVAENARRSGLDLSAIELTQNGFVSR